MRVETQIQRSIRDYLYARGFQTVHVPNGATLSGDKDERARQMANLKRDGLMPGFPDLLVYGSRGRIGHIEVKAEGGRLNANQLDVQRWLELWGFHYAVCRSIEDVAETLDRWGWTR